MPQFEDRMLTVSAVMTTFGVAAVIGTPLTVYLWRVRRRRHEISRGLATLAAMRWREFSGFVVDALRAQGFEADRLESSPKGEQAAELKLTRNGESWLLSCKQGLNYRIDAAHVAALADAVRFDGATGGIVATLGSVQKDARGSNRGMELMDGPAVWALVEAQLPAGLRNELAEHARRRSVRETVIAWIVALLAGGAIAYALPIGDGAAPAAATTAPAPAAVQDAPVPAAATPATVERDPGTAAPGGDAPSPNPVPEPAPAAPAGPQAPAQATPPDEAQQRRQVVERVRQLSGIKRVAWSTRSTLLIDMDGTVADGPGFTRPICAVLESYEPLRASRLQLQPPEGSDQRVRFMQCRAY